MKIIHIILTACALYALSACTTTKPENVLNSPPPQDIGESVAHFDYFVYKGMDDYYNQNPLEGTDEFFNPILPGWYSDPSICTDGENYFMITSTFGYFPGVPIFHSTDLINWTQIGHVLDRTTQLEKLEGQQISGGIFAPAIEYNPHNKTYYMITTNVGAGNFFVKTKDPFGSWSEPIYLPEVDGIDPSLFFDDDGKAYIVHNSSPDGTPLYEGHRAIRVIEFDPNSDKTIGKGKVIVNGGVDISKKPIWIEGPHLYKINGRYLLMAAEGGTGPDHSEVIFEGKSPLSGFIPWKGNPILTQRHLDPNRPNPITCTGHADLIQSREGDWWTVFLACRPINNKFENLGRETFIMPVRWSDDGFPIITQNEELVPMVVRREGVPADENRFPSGNFEKISTFDSSKLDMEWMTLRTPIRNLYSLTDNPNYLSLKCIDISAMEKKAPAFVCRRLQHHQFEVSTRIFFEPTKAEDAAGILLFKDESHQYFLALKKSNELKKVVVQRVTKDGSEDISSREIKVKKNESIFLKIISTGENYSFYYAPTEDEWVLIAENVDASYLSTAVAGGFTGTTIGMYATGK